LQPEEIYDLAERLEVLTADAKVQKQGQGSIPASSDTVESEGQQMKSVDYMEMKIQAITAIKIFLDTLQLLRHNSVPF
jgi:hypothetical protein